MCSSLVDWSTTGSSTTYATVMDTDATLVYSGNVTFPAGTNTTPAAWIPVTLQTPFLYDPTLGKDFILQIKSAGPNSAVMSAIDLHSGGSAQRYGSQTSATLAAANFANSNIVGVCKIDFFSGFRSLRVVRRDAAERARAPDRSVHQHVVHERSRGHHQLRMGFRRRRHRRLHPSEPHSHLRDAGRANGHAYDDGYAALAEHADPSEPDQRSAVPVLRRNFRRGVRRSHSDRGPGPRGTLVDRRLHVHFVRRARHGRHRPVLRVDPRRGDVVEFLHAAAPGFPLHYTRVPGVYPEAPLVVPPGTFSGFAGITIDFVQVGVTPAFGLAFVSNVSRATF
jgi:hypothetical protein